MQSCDFSLSNSLSFFTIDFLIAAKVSQTFAYKDFSNVISGFFLSVMHTEMITKNDISHEGRKKIKDAGNGTGENR